MHFKFESTEEGDAFNGIFDAVSKVIHGIDMIGVACVMMLGVFDAVDGGIAHVKVGGCHVDPSAQNTCTFGEIASFHFIKERCSLEWIGLFRRFASWLCRYASIGFKFVLRQIAYVGATFFDELSGIGFHLIEIGGGPVEMVAPIIS